MAELMFKRGAQTALDAIIKNKQAVDGCFYLTEDTNRLYVGQGDNTAPVLLNQTVQVVKTYQDLPSSPPAADNDFYYIKDSNILAVYDSTADTESKWIQINPDTNTNDIVTVDDIEFTRTSASSDEVVYTLTLSQKKYDIDNNEIANAGLEDITATLVLKTEDIANIVPEAAEVGLTTENIPSGGVNITTIGEGSNPTSLISLIPGDNIDSITSTDGKITINAHNNTYEADVVIDDDDGTVYLQLTDKLVENTTNIKLIAGKDVVITGNETDDSVTLSHSIYNTESKSVTNKASLNPEDTLHIISGITLDNGHITNIETADVKMPFDTHLVGGVSHTDGSWQATFADNNDSTWTIDFSNDANSLQNTLKDYIDKGLAAANTALTYKGTIANPTALEFLFDVEVGDVYLLSENYATDMISYRKGDLFIAVSKSDAAGKLESNDIEWTYVPSGDELIIDTHFKGVAIVSGKAGIVDNENNGAASFHIEAKQTSDGNINTPADNETLQLIAGQDLEIINNTASGSKSKVATVRHTDIITTTPDATIENDVFTINAITGVTVENGHVTQIDTTDYNIVTYDLSGNDNRIVLTDSAINENGSIGVSGDDTWISATVNNNSLKVVHTGPGAATHDITVTNTPTALVQEGALNIISGVHYDNNGHITGVDTQALEMPKDTTYTSYVSDGNIKLINAATASNPSLVLEDRNGNTWSTQISSENESLTVTGSANKVTFNLVWGSF